MKTKRFLLSAALLGMLAFEVQKADAQAYVNVNLGYGFNAASRDWGQNNSGSSAITTHTGVKGSLGAGFGMGAGFGFMVTENFGAEVGIGYLMGSKITSTGDLTDAVKFGPVTQTTHDVWNEDISANMLRIMPGVKIMCGKKLMPFAKFGLVFGMAGKITDTYSDTKTVTLSTSSTPTTTVTDQAWEYTGGLSTGLYGSFGVAFKLNDKMSLSAECMAITQSWAPTHSAYTTYTVDGKDQLATMTTNLKETDYVDSYTDPTTVATGSPSQTTKFYVPMSSVAINIGFTMSFGK